MGSLLLKKKLQPQGLNSGPLERSHMTKTHNIHLHHAALYSREKLVLYNVPLSPRYHTTPKSSIGKSQCSIWASTNKHFLFQPPPPPSFTMLSSPPPSFHHHHPRFTTTTVTIANGRHSHPSPTPTTTTASTKSATSQWTETVGGACRCHVAESDVATK